MKRLKQLRESMNITQQDLAMVLHTTQQTIARWESGKSQPDIMALKDLALFFQTSVDDLLEYAKSGQSVRSSLYWLDNKERDGFWGHIGIKLANKPSVWFPITKKISCRIENALENMTQDKAWVLFPTLVNQYVAIQPALLSKISLINDDADQPADDWHLTYPYEGLPLEIYKGFSQLSPGDVTDKEIASFTRLFQRKQEEKLNSQEKEKYDRYLTKYKKIFGCHSSEYFIVTVLNCFLDENLTQEDRYWQYMTQVNVYDRQGVKQIFLDKEETLRLNIDKIQNPESFSMLCFNSPEEGVIFLPISQIAMITVPYLTTLKIMSTH